MEHAQTVLFQILQPKNSSFQQHHTNTPHHLPRPQDDARTASALLCEPEWLLHRYETLLAAAAACNYTISLDNGQVVQATYGPGCHIVTGYESEDFSFNLHLFEQLIYPDDQQRMRELLVCIYEGIATAPLEHRIIHKDGSMRWVRHTLVPYYDQQGMLIAYDGLLADITHSKQAETALRNSRVELEQKTRTYTRQLAEREAHYRALVHNATDLVSVCDSQGYITYVSPSVSRVLGYAADELIGHSYFAFLHPDDARRIEASFQAQTTQTRPSEPVELRFRHRDGTWRYLEAVTTNLLHDPAVQGMVINARDITARRQLAEQRTLLDLAIQQAADAVLITDAVLDHSGPHIVLANQAFYDLCAIPAPLNENVPDLLDGGVLGALFGAFVSTSATPAEQRRFTSSVVMGQMPRAIHGAATDRTVLLHLKLSLQRGEICHGETMNIRDDGSTFYVEWHISPVRDAYGRITQFVSLQRDVTARKLEEILAYDQRAVLELMVRGKQLTPILHRLFQMLRRQLPHMQAAIWVINEGHLLHHIAPTLPTDYIAAIENISNGPCYAAVSQGTPMIVTDTTTETRWPEWQAIALEHDIGGCWVVPILIGDGSAVHGAIALYAAQAWQPAQSDQTLIDMVSQMAALAIEHNYLSDQLTYHTSHDVLTGLPNRTHYVETVQRTLNSANHPHRLMAVCVIDLDRFKQINDTLGHPTGDYILTQVAERFKSSMSDHDTLARMGSDEFALLLTDLRTVQDAVRITQQLLRLLTVPFTVGERQLVITASIGISLYPQDGSDVTTLLKHAESAMHRAKVGGINTVMCFAPDMTALALEKLDLEHQLRYALDEGELELYYQPQIDLATNQIAGVEALLRWHHPRRGLLGPGQFIDLAEASGLIVPIGAWVLEQACHQAARWQHYDTPVRIGVNVTATQFEQEDFVDMVRNILDQSGLSPSLLDLEITERMLMEHHQAGTCVIKKLRQIGVRVSIDDFGTGYSSLAYLQKFPIDTLKIDRAFVQELTPITTDAGTSDGVALVNAVVQLAHSLKLNIIAEGVETTDQLDILRHIGCDEVQGYLYSRPVTTIEMEALLAAGSMEIAAECV